MGLVLGPLASLMRFKLKIKIKECLSVTYPYGLFAIRGTTQVEGVAILGKLMSATIEGTKVQT